MPPERLAEGLVEPDDCSFGLDLSRAGTSLDRPSGAGLLDNHRPFLASIRLREPDRIMRSLGLPHDPDPKLRSAMASVIANAIQAAMIGAHIWVFYSRDRTHYVGRGKYFPSWYRLARMTAAVDGLEDLGLIDHRRTRPSPGAKYRSSFRASERLRQALGAIDLGLLEFVQEECVLLRDADGDFATYRNSRSICALRKDVMAHNAFLCGHEITVEHPEVENQANGLLKVGGGLINPARTG